MLNVGLTGNIGSGKTWVSRIFVALGIPVYHADAASKKFLESPEVIRSLKSLFGPTVLDAGGSVDRAALAGLVFSDRASLQELNNLLHPLVREDARKWSGKHKDHPYLIHEAAIIFESGFRNEYDAVIHVSCPKDTAILRVTERDGVTREEVLSRMQFQMEDEKKAALSDFVIRNDGSEMLVPQVLEIHRQLLERSA